MPERERPMTQTIKAYTARQHWGELLNRVFRHETRVVVEKSGIPVAALVSMDDLARLQHLESGQQDALTSASTDPDLTTLFEETRQRNREVPVDADTLFARPSAAEVARRRAVYEQIQAHRHERVIAPLTAADLIHQARAEEEEAYGTNR